MMKSFAVVAMLGLLAACGGTATAPVAPGAVSHDTRALVPSGQEPRAILNAIRGKAGRGTVRRSPRLDRTALRHAQDMQRQRFFSHTGSDGSNVGERARAADYDWCLIAENIGWGQRDIAAAIAGWESSPTHYRNLTRSGMEDFGIASFGGYNVMVLGARHC